VLNPPTAQRTLGLLVDDYGIGYGPGWWPYYRNGKPESVRLAPDTAFYAWRDQYVLVGPADSVTNSHVIVTLALVAERRPYDALPGLPRPARPVGHRAGHGPRLGTHRGAGERTTSPGPRPGRPHRTTPQGERTGHRPPAVAGRRRPTVTAIPVAIPAQVTAFRWPVVSAIRIDSPAPAAFHRRRRPGRPDRGPAVRGAAVDLWPDRTEVELGTTT